MFSSFSDSETINNSLNLNCISYVEYESPLELRSEKRSVEQVCE